METLKNEIKNVIDSTDIGISIYTLLKNNEIRKLDIESESLNDLKKMFIDYINSEIISDQDKSVLKWAKYFCKKKNPDVYIGRQKS